MRPLEPTDAQPGFSGLAARALLLLIAICALSGCSDSSADALFSDYVGRLENVIRAESSPRIKLIPWRNYPRYRDLHREITGIRIGFGDFFSLDQCQLMQEISQRNSSLGRLQSTATQLHYELNLLAKLQQCEKRFIPGSDEEQQSFQKMVRRILKSKQGSLPQLRWNSSFASAEFQALFSPAATALSPESPANPVQLHNALNNLKGLLQGSPQDNRGISEAALNQIFFVIQSEAVMTPLLKGMRIATAYLEKASLQLEMAEQQKRLCPMQKTTPQARYAHNVFVKYYAGQIQPYLSRLYAAGRHLIPQLNQLQEIQQPVQTAAFASYFAAMLSEQQPSSLWRQFQSQLTRHTKAWQALLRQCDLMPKGPESLKIQATSP